MIKCPICQTEYSEEGIETCLLCSWSLNTFSQVNPDESLSRNQLLEIAQQIEAWGRKLWEQRHLKLENVQQEPSEENIEEIEEERSLIQINTTILLNQFTRLISPLEQRLDNIEQYLGAKTQDNDLAPDAVFSGRKAPPIPQDIQTSQFEAFSEPTEIHLSLLEAQLLAQYYKESNSLLNQAIQVSQTEESLTQPNKPAIFETSHRGNYWIITLENLTYLAPKKNLKINQYNYKTIEKLFQCYGYETVNSNEFLLLKAAEVTPTATGRNWQLVKPGILQFIAKEDNEFPIEEETPLDSKEPIVPQIQEIADSQNCVTIPLKTQTKPTPNQVNPSPIDPQEFTVPIESRQPPAEIYLSTQEAELVIDYNNNPNYLSRIGTEVLETEASIQQRREDKSQILIFEKNRWGNYWIINKGDLDYLVPRANLKINKNNYERLEGLFESYGYQPDLSTKFQLIKPARISSLSGKQWQILELGMLQFSSI